MGVAVDLSASELVPDLSDRSLLRANTMARLPLLVGQRRRRMIAVYAMAYVATFPVYQQFVHETLALVTARTRHGRYRLIGMLAESHRLSDAQSLFITHARSLDFDVADALNEADRRCRRWTTLSPLARLGLVLLLADHRLQVVKQLGRRATHFDLDLVAGWTDWHREQADEQQAVTAALWQEEAARYPDRVARAAWKQAQRHAAWLAVQRAGDGDRILARHSAGIVTRLLLAPGAAMTALATLWRIARRARPRRGAADADNGQ